MNNNELTITGIDGRAVDLLDLVDNSAVTPIGNLFIVHPSIMWNEASNELYAITYLWTITHLPTGGAIGYAPDPVIAIKMARTIDDELGQDFDFADPNNVPEGLSKRAKIIRRRILAEYNEHWSI